MPDAIEAQQAHWSATFAARPDFLGASPSEPARKALERFQATGARTVLELGPGQGRDTLLFLDAGLDVTALDYAADGLEQLSRKAAEVVASGAHLGTVTADVRRPLPFENDVFDACYAHMLFCMALTTLELVQLAGEVRRVLRPGGLLVYTVRNTDDAHFQAGVDHGDGMFEMGGFIVHFFDRALIERLADGFELLEVAEYEEGKLPRRLFGITMRKT